MATQGRGEVALGPGDNKATGPVLNLATPAERLPIGHFWKLDGVDGRFTNTLRRFPGFKELSYSVSTDSNSRPGNYPIGNATRFDLLKCVTIPKGSTDYVLRGFVLVVNREVTDGVTPGTAVIFLHYDNEDNRWYTSLIKISDSETVQVDVAVAGHYLLVSLKGETGAVIWWRKEGDAGWATSDTGLQIYDSSGYINTISSITGVSGYLGGAQPTEYRIRTRWYSPGRALWGPLSEEGILSLGAGSTSQGGSVSLLKTTVKAQVQQGFTKFYVYRTINEGGTLYLEQIVNFNDPLLAGVVATPPSADDLMVGPDHGSAPTNYAVRVGGLSTNHNPQGGVWSLGMNDVALTFQKPYDPFFDEFGEIPKSGLLSSYGDALVARDEPESGTTATTATIRWSSVYQPSPQNWPGSDHFYRPSTRGQKVLNLVEAGDYCFAVREDGVVRLHRNGTVMAINELYRKIGGKNRFGSTSMGQFLFLVTPLGLVQVDGTSGRQDIVAAVERLIIDPKRWRQSLDKVHLSFDSELGALCLLNTEKEEIYWLWVGNGAVTSLQNTPFIYTAEGPDPETGGQDVAWFLTSDGRLFTPNSDRTSERQTMCGASANEIVNAKVEFIVDNNSPNTSTSFTLKHVENGTPWPPPTGCVGFQVHILSGANKGKSRKITAITSGALVYDRKLPSAMATDDIVSIAPIVFEVGFWPVREGERADLFSRKVLNDMVASVRIHSGDRFTSKLAHGNMIYRVHQSEDLVDREQEVLMQESSGNMLKKVDSAGQNLFPVCRQVGSDIDFELQELFIHATIGESEQRGRT